MGHGDGDASHHDISREELLKPFKPSVAEKYILPFFGSIVDAPVTFFREQIVEKVRKPYPFYHKRYKRVPTIDKCRLDDPVCIYEANMQYHRDRMVDTNILRILRNRRRECSTWHRHQKEDVERFCKDIIAEHEEAVVNFFIKYGELSWNTDVRHAFWKQKHRMLWERRYGPVGNGDSPAFAVDRAMAAAEETLKKEDNMFTKLRASVGQIGFPKEMRP
ncbi:hypothetical protein P879_03717 [Paragonimus westermani]|uniref:NADH dehydrogenase [ubiquinone] 1 beta subcomplex subunit 10 n=1 Tax=Paragonimus westermani TaxID=34504 RepID=A0A8T0DK33_9TREM|nr:hypothetical protein P879_03717 [Paragonimus westermani]